MILVTLDVFYCKDGQKLRARKEKLSGMTQCSLIPKTNWERTVRQQNLNITRE